VRLTVRFTKRVLDVACSAVGLAVCAPLFPLIAVAIAIDSRGPVFYHQLRAGKLRSTTLTSSGLKLEFHEFHMTKFRTMQVDAEKHTGAVLAADRDPRITRVGSWLRKTRLDELPQFWDVLRGKMSLVGPRPERPQLIRDLAHAIPLFEERMRGVKPGITGLAQVSLGYSGAAKEGSEIAQLAASMHNPFDLEEADGAIADDMRIKLLYDLAYLTSLEKFSTYLWMEISVIVKTPLVMLRGVGR